MKAPKLVPRKRAYIKKNRRLGQIEAPSRDNLISTRFELAVQKDFVEEAALVAEESAGEFTATASIERAQRVLKRSCPSPASAVPVQIRPSV